MDNELVAGIKMPERDLHERRIRFTNGILFQTDLKQGTQPLQKDRPHQFQPRRLHPIRISPHLEEQRHSLQQVRRLHQVQYLFIIVAM